MNTFVLLLIICFMTLISFSTEAVVFIFNLFMYLATDFFIQLKIDTVPTREISTFSKWSRMWVACESFTNTELQPLPPPRVSVRVFKCVKKSLKKWISLMKEDNSEYLLLYVSMSSTKKRKEQKQLWNTTKSL